MHAKYHLLTCEGVLNPSTPRERDNGKTQSPSFVRNKRITDGRKQKGQIGSHGIGGDNTGLIVTPLI